ncbi:choice-of-anchor L domain-containing protein [Taibaiella koreensis]|uniref:choice-of-anchor L domain-containing protein n=1 Tax=Taibaiella koreensis TaxID=1268548 RepID=UPI000E59F298|nr:choice-of-anchor L domain-containing protein [Taibaiella koreensis]
MAYFFPRIFHLVALALSLWLFTGYTTNAQVQITANQAAAVLAQRLAGQGINITNASLTCADGANGRFVVQSSNLGLDSGIVLSTGLVLNINQAEPGPTSTSNGTPGDPALQTLSGASSTRDACILEFDMVPKGDEVKFDYVFASEEYINSICGPYNDAFAFFISGPGIAGTVNMARVPGTNIPVTVNTINNGIPGSLAGGLANCTSMGPGSPFTAYYVDNAGGSTIAYRGFTRVLTAANTVIPCQTYHLKLTVADAQNALYDSGVFIKAGSLQSASFTVKAQGPGAASNPPFVARGCAPGSLIFSRAQAKPTPQVLQLQVSGNAIAGTDYTALPPTVTIPANATSVSIPVTALASPTPLGPRILKVAVLSPYNCNGPNGLDDSTQINIVDPPQATILTPDTTVCAGVGFVVRVQGNSSTLQYSWSPTSGLSSGTAKEPMLTPQGNTTYTMTAVLPNSGCASVSDAITVSVIPAPQTVDAGEQIDLCINTPVQFQPQVDPDNGSFNYQWSGPKDFSSSKKNAEIAAPQVDNSGWYLLAVNAQGCPPVIDSVYLNVVVSPPLPIVVSPVKYCIDEQKPLQASGKDLRWYQDAEGGSPSRQAPVVNSHNEGKQTFYVTQSYGDCESERVPIAVTVERCCGDDLFVPNAFSPNGDGLNDVFELKLDHDSKILQIDIFNRWGQRVFQQYSFNRPWDGNFNGQPLQPGSYFYSITVSCRDGRTVYKKGDVVLIR